MTVEPVSRQSLLERRSLLFSPNPRLGWLSRDRWAVYTPFTDPQPQPQRLPDYLHQQVTQTEQVAQRRLARTLPLSLTDYSLGKTSVPAGSTPWALICLASGAVLTEIAVSARRNARAAYELARRALTKQPGLEDSMARAAANPIACAVKRADNSDPDRLALLDTATAQRLRHKYADSTRLLDRYAKVAPGSTDGR
ncbi:MAG TPA: hypothetical protein VGD53_26375 [Actinoallomurus sp.]|jgi:hypothetical protein